MSATTDTTERQSGRHPVNVGHLVMGVAFLGLVGIWAVIQSDGVDHDEIRWLLPIPWVLAGLAGLVAMSASSRRKWSTRQVGWVEPTPEPEPEPDWPDLPSTPDLPEPVDPAAPVESSDVPESPEPPEENR